MALSRSGTTIPVTKRSPIIVAPPARFSVISHHLKMFGTVFQHVVHAHPGETRSQVQRSGRKAFDDFLEHHSANHSSEVVSQTEVWTGAERQVLRLVAAVQT